MKRFIEIIDNIGRTYAWSFHDYFINKWLDYFDSAIDSEKFYVWYFIPVFWLTGIATGTMLMLPALVESVIRTHFNKFE